MHLFYCPDISGDTYTLNEEESKHCSRVLRLKKGDEIRITDGRGRFFNCLVSLADPKKCKVYVHSVITSSGRSETRLHIGIAPTKNIDRYEWFLEKAAEIGIDEITPIFCHRSERLQVKTERQEKVLVAAMKQSLKSWLPVLNEPVEFSKFIKSDLNGEKYIASCDVSKEQGLLNMLRGGREILVLIGPEGDFTPEEVTFATASGFQPVSLGESRLRTETAGIVVCCLMMGI